MDTAGFRKAQNEVEKIGLRLTKEKLSNADLILLVLDQSQPLSSEDMSILKKSPRTNTVVIFNKIDLPPSKDFKKLSSELSQYRIVRTCALSGEGIEDLISSIKDMILKGRIEGDLSGIAPNLRHKSVLLKTRDYLTSGMENLTNNAPLEIIADDIRSALDTLGEITGETATEEVLENIFNSFCIGK